MRTRQRDVASRTSRIRIGVPSATRNNFCAAISRDNPTSSLAPSSLSLSAADEESAAERDKLEGANDDVGLSLLIAAQKLFLVAEGTPIRILEVREATSRCLVRILEGEHYGKTALVPLEWTAEVS